MTSLSKLSWATLAVFFFFCFFFSFASADSTGSNAPTTYGLTVDISLTVPNPSPLNQGLVRWGLGDVASQNASFPITDYLQGANGANLGKRTSFTGLLPYRTYILMTSALEASTGSVTFQVTGAAGASIKINGRPSNSVPVSYPSPYSSGSQNYKFYSFQIIPQASVVQDLEPAYLGAGASTSISQDKPVWFIGLGRQRDGSSAGVVGFRQDTINSSTFTPSALYLASQNPIINAEVDNIYTTYLRQVLSREVLLDIVTDTATSYHIDVYSRQASTITQPGGHGTVCTISGTPFVTYNISQPSAGTLDITRVEDGITWETSLANSGSTWTFQDWHKQGTSLSSSITTTYTTATSASVSTSGPSSGLAASVPGYTDTGLSWTKTFALNTLGQAVLSEISYGTSETTPVISDYGYYSSSAASGTSGGYVNMVKWKTEGNGTWKSYTYNVGTGPTDTAHPDGTINTIYYPWLDNRAGTAATTAANSPDPTIDGHDTYTYTYVQKGLGSSGGVTESVWLPSSLQTYAPSASNGTLMSQTNWTYSTNAGTINGHATWSQTRQDYWEPTLAHHLDTVSRFITPASATGTYADYFDNKPVSVTYPTGKKDSYIYITGTWDPVAAAFTASTTGNDRLTICLHGRASTTGATNPVWVTAYSQNGVTWNPDSVVMESNRSVLDETVIDTYGRVVVNAKAVFTGSGTSVISEVVNYYDSHGRLSNVVDLFHSVPGTLYQTQYTYSSGLVQSVTAPDGVQTAYQYDDLLRNTGKIVGANGPTLYPAQTLTTVYDGANRPVSVMTNATAPAILYYDTAGRVIKRAESNPNSGYLYTTYAYNSPTSTTTTFPNGSTNTTTMYGDGRVKSVSGTAQAPKYYAYAMNSAGLRTTVYNNTSADGSWGWGSSQSDLLGRVTTQNAPTTGWTSGNNNYFTISSTYDQTTGLLSSISTTYAATGARLSPNHLYLYNGAGRLTQEGLDVNNDGSLTAGSNDRISVYDHYFSQDSAGWLSVRTESTYPTLNSSTLQQLSKTLTRLTGFNGGALGTYGLEVAEVTTVDSNNQSAKQADFISVSNLRHHLTTTLPGIANTAYTETINGYASSSVSAAGDVIEKEYDSLGRLATTHSRWNGSVYLCADTISYCGNTTFVSSQTTDGISKSFSYAWNSTAGTSTVTTSDAVGSAYTLYNSMGLPLHLGGAAASSVQYGYDQVGRETSMTTWRSANYTEANWPSSTSTGDTTTWTIEHVTGLVTQKLFADGNHVDFTYTPLGHPSARTWARGTTTTYHYFDGHNFDGSATATTDASYYTQELSGISYSDGTTSLSFSYNRNGTSNQVTDAAGTRTFNYDATQTYRITSETLPSTYFGGRIMTQLYDAVYRPDGFQLGTSTTPAADLSQSYGYDATTGLVTSLSTTPSGQTARAFNYTYLANSSMYTGYNTTVAAGTYTMGYSYQPSTNLRLSSEATFGSTVISQFDRTYNSRGLLQAVRQSGTAFADYYNSSYTSVLNEFWYDNMGQLQTNALYRGTTSVTSPSSADELPGHHFEFRYDSMGNRTSAGETGQLPANGGTDDSFTPNSVNQITDRTNYTVRTQGTVASTSGLYVAVAGASSTGKLDRVWGADLVPGQGSSAANGNVAVYAALPGGGTGGQDLVRLDNSKSWMIPPAAQHFTYDGDGNMTADTIWNYGYDAENRLISMTSLLPAGLGFQRWNLTFQYDYLGRRIQKTATNLDNSSLSYTSRYIYNGRNMVAELDSAGSSVLRSYTWGKDANGLFTSGGAGALLEVTDQASGKNYFPAYDHNGNVVAMTRDTGALAAAYEYSPFGEAMRTDIFDATIATSSFKFSTQYQDIETGLYYYGDRYYSASLGRFINRDPISEAGGNNLYAFCANNPVSRTDSLGHSSGAAYGAPNGNPPGPPPKGYYSWDAFWSYLDGLRNGAVTYQHDPDPYKPWAGGGAQDTFSYDSAVGWSLGVTYAGIAADEAADEAQSAADNLSGTAPPPPSSTTTTPGTAGSTDGAKDAVTPDQTTPDQSQDNTPTVNPAAGDDGGASSNSTADTDNSIGTYEITVDRNGSGYEATYTDRDGNISYEVGAQRDWYSSHPEAQPNASWGFYRWLYTGDGHAPDNVYNAAVSAAATFLQNDAGVRGVYGGVGVGGKYAGRGNLAGSAGITGEFTLDHGASVVAIGGVGLQDRGRNSMGQFTSQTIGVGAAYQIWSSEGGFQPPTMDSVAAGVYGGTNNSQGGGNFFFGTDRTFALGLNSGYAYGGVIIDIDKMTQNIVDSYNILSGK